MLIHFRLTAPRDLSAPVQQLVLDHDWATNVTVQEGAVRRPPGDLIECDVAREKAGEVLAALEEIGMEERGGIVITTPTGTPFAAARALESRAPGHPDDAVIWESVEAQAQAGAVPTLSFHIFLVIAVTLASIAVVTDSSILVVGAMVVGPEFSAIAAACAGIVLGQWGLVYRSLRLLAFSFTFAVLAVTLFALVLRATGALTVDLVTRPRPNTGFIWHPDKWSIIVALLAGAAGALALAIARSAVMVGVFISVTTVPAAGNLALGIAVWDPGEMVGSLTQLGANIGCMLVSGSLLLLFVRTCWPWLAERSERIFGTHAPTPARGNDRRGVS
ncbi:MAG: DUF389 domain-containing protein [Nocardioides sp.]